MTRATSVVGCTRSATSEFSDSTHAAHRQETGIALDLRELIRAALDSVGSDIARLGGKSPAEGLSEEIYDYMMERLRAWYLEADRGVSTEMFEMLNRRNLSMTRHPPCTAHAWPRRL